MRRSKAGVGDAAVDQDQRNATARSLGDHVGPQISFGDRQDIRLPMVQEPLHRPTSIRWQIAVYYPLRQADRGKSVNRRLGICGQQKVC